jgi:hypothetical protein
VTYRPPTRKRPPHVPDLDLTLTITAGAYNDPQFRQIINGVLRRVVAAVRE